MRKKKKDNILLGFLLLSFCCYSQSAYSQTQTIITGTETSSNLLPDMSTFSTSGSTKIGVGQGCAIDAYCTSGESGGGGTFTSTFQLPMTINQINSGFDLNYGVDVKSHSTNATAPVCSGIQGQDCKDTWTLTVNLLETSHIVKTFTHTVVLDFSGMRSYAYQQSIAANSYQSLTGKLSLFGIDSGFQSQFHGPQFSNPSLTATYNLISLIETQVIDIINTTDILDNLPPETDISTIEIEVQDQGGAVLTEPLFIEVETQMAEVIELQTPMEAPIIATSLDMEIQSSDIEMEMNNELTTDQPLESAELNSTDGNTQESAASTENTESNGESSQGETNEEETTQEESSSNGEQPVDGEGNNSSADQEENSDESSKVNTKKQLVRKQKLKEKVSKKIMAKMGDKGRYDSTNQLRTLIVMNVLGADKKFFDPKNVLKDNLTFFTEVKIPDGQIEDNHIAAYFLMGESSVAHKALTDLQY